MRLPEWILRILRRRRHVKMIRGIERAQDSFLKLDREIERTRVRFLEKKDRQ